jgi:hypothetical protein
MMQSIEEHQEIPKEDAAVMPVGGPRKGRRSCNLAAERCQKMSERTQGNSGSRRKSAAACRKVSRRAKLEWRKRNLIRKIRTLEKCGRRKELTAARIRTTRCAKVARRKGHSYEGPSIEQERGKNKTRNKIYQRNPNRTDARKEATDAPGRHQWSQEPRLQLEAASWKREDNQRNLQEVHWTGNREANCQMYCWATKNQRLDLVEGSARPKRKKKLHIQEEPIT